jgi:AraC family transcriptional regulator of arabinose operon
MINMPKHNSNLVMGPSGLSATVLMSDYADEPYGYRIQRSMGRPDWLITYTTGGEGIYRLGETTYRCRPGNVVLLGPGAEHDYATATIRRNWQFFWAHFVPERHWRQWLALPEVAPGLSVAQVENQLVGHRLKTAFERLVQDNRNPDPFQELLSLNALEEVLILVSQQYQIGRVRPMDARIGEVLRQISDNFQEPLTVTALAESVALSPSRLAHLFREQTGETPIQTLLKMRLWQASRLLEFTPHPVGEIAREVGFQSAYYFSRQFKAHYGLSPTAYRNAVARPVKPTP